MSADNEIQELNVAYLMMVKRMLSEDKNAAMIRLKLTESTADAISQLSSTQIAQFANIDQLLFQPSFDGLMAINSVVEAAAGRTKGLATTHAAILMASRRGSDFHSLEHSDMAAIG